MKSKSDEPKEEWGGGGAEKEKETKKIEKDKKSVSFY